jgi:hypothetical protein
VPVQPHEDDTADFSEWEPETITPEHDDFDNSDGSGRSWRKQ